MKHMIKKQKHNEQSIIYNINNFLKTFHKKGDRKDTGTLELSGHLSITDIIYFVVLIKKYQLQITYTWRATNCRVLLTG